MSHGGPAAAPIRTGGAMRVSGELKHPAGARSRPEGAEDGDVTELSRRVLTRDLLARAERGQPGERHALQFRALHLNLAIVSEVVDGLGLTGGDRLRAEHHGLDGLHEAVAHYDPCGDGDFAELAASYVERRVRAHLHPTPLVVAVSPV
jgi:hypothetical protein